jgi:hypothetical protein
MALRFAGILIAAPALAILLSCGQAHGSCSVFDSRPCTPTFCSVFGPVPCIPEFEPPIGQDLRLTVESRPTRKPVLVYDAERLNTLRELFAALRACWTPPPLEDGRAGMEVSVRLSFDRDGNIIGQPRFTYSSPDASAHERDTYRRAVIDSLARCAPLPLTAGLGGAIAGRPIAIRYIDNRDPRRSTS